LLDIALQNVFVRRGNFELREISLTFTTGTHTAITGAAGAGASTLLDIVAGRLQPDRGDVIFGTRRVTGVKMSARPVLHATSEIGVPARWSVQHALVAAVRRRTLDRIDRRREVDLAVDQWELTALLERRIGSLSESERLRVHLARIELLKPAVLAADRVLERMNASVVNRMADKFYRMLRVIGTTVISAPSTLTELGHTNSVVVLDRGFVEQSGSSAEVYARANSVAVAAATGDINRIPVTIHGRTVDSPIGSWEANPPFEGDGFALIRPEDLTVARAGEDSDLILGVEEARFRDGVWEVTGFVTGGLSVRVRLPGTLAIHKGKLIALRYDPNRFQLLRI
jgi:ABC-type sugar transport system ATPase subunit